MRALKQWIDRRRSVPGAVTYGPIGVYVTQEHVHLVQLQTLDDGGIGVRAHAALAYPGTRTELLSSRAASQKLFRRAMRSGDFRGRQVISAMPPEQVRVMSVSYPANASNEAGTIARLMADRVDGALENYVIDYVPIRTSSRDGDRLALVAVSSLEHVNQYLDCLGSAGLHVDFLEIGPLAIKRLIEWGPGSDQNNNVVVANIGSTTSHLTTISGHRLLADQEVMFGEATILDALAKSLNLEPRVVRDLVFSNGLDPAQGATTGVGGDSDTDIVATLIEIVKPEFLRLVREIERAFLFADSESHGDRAKKLFIVGGIARWPGAASLLSSLAKMPVESLGCDHLPLVAHSAKVPKISDQQAAEMSTAVGLALRGLLPDE